MSNAVMSTYARFPITLVQGKGSYVWDDAGKQYLDFTSGIATCNLGHVPDAVKAKLDEQLGKLWHCSNLYHIPPQQQLAALLVENSFADHVFFCNSGAEANEAAIKLARRYAQKVKGTEQFEVVTFHQSFHGRTMATLSATAQEKIQHGFKPLVQGFRYLPYNDMTALDELVRPETCAVLLEVVQGEGGVLPADPAWLTQLAALCKQHNILLMIDEIQTGMGRTGSLFAYQQYGIEPDVMTLAKGLGSGFPIGAMLAKADVAQAFDAGSHGSTFGGNPLATTAGLATLSHMLESDVLAQSAELATHLHEQLHALAKKYEIITEVRGKGLLAGLLLNKPAVDIVTQAREQHNLLILSAGPDVVRILPPLTATKQEVDVAVQVLDTVFASMLEAST